LIGSFSWAGPSFLLDGMRGRFGFVIEAPRGRALLPASEYFPEKTKSHAFQISDRGKMSEFRSGWICYAVNLVKI
jgi:hypothetical protein